MLAYSCGLRVSEVAKLRTTDLDSDRMVIHVREGKGRKDRLVPLSPFVLEVLREYWREARPRDYLFPGKFADRPVTISTIQKVVGRAAATAGIKKRVSMHSLRHHAASGVMPSRVASTGPSGGGRRACALTLSA